MPSTAENMAQWESGGWQHNSFSELGCQSAVQEAWNFFN